MTLRIIPELEMTDLTRLLGLGICDRIMTGFGSGDDVSGFLPMDKSILGLNSFAVGTNVVFLLE